MAKEFKITSLRLADLEKELTYLKTTREREIAAMIAEARSYGDLSENSEYDAAKNEQAKLYGRIIGVKDFDMYNDDGEKVFDGSAILGIMADKNWFKVKSQDVEMDVFFNPNNRVYTYYLNVVKMYNYSLFANAVVFATEEPSDYSY